MRPRPAPALARGRGRQPLPGVVLESGRRAVASVPVASVPVASVPVASVPVAAGVHALFGVWQAPVHLPIVRKLGVSRCGVALDRADHSSWQRAPGYSAGVGYCR